MKKIYFGLVLSIVVGGFVLSGCQKPATEQPQKNIVEKSTDVSVNKTTNVSVDGSVTIREPDKKDVNASINIAPMKKNN